MIDCYWSLFNTVDKVRIDGIQSKQLKILLKSFDPHAVAQWLIWQEDTTAWRPLQEIVLEIAEAAATELRAFPAKPPTPPLAPLPRSSAPIPLTEEVTMTSQAEPQWRDDEGARIANVDKRVDARFDQKFTVIVDHEGTMYKNETVDISMGGMRLRDTLPKDLADMVQVTLINDSQKLIMVCKPVRMSEDAPVVRLMILKCARLDLLRTWILTGSG